MNINELFRRRWVKLITGLSLLVVILAALTPLGLKYYLIHWLKQNGADSASIESLSINPFRGKITLDGLDIQGGQRSILQHSKLVLDLDLTSLVDRDVRVERAEYRDLFIEIEQSEDGRWRYGSYTMSGQPRAKELDAPKATGPEWGFRADQVVIANCRVQLKTPTLETLLVIDSAELDRFTTRQADHAASLNLTGTINDSPLTIDLATLQLKPELTVDGKIAFSSFDLQTLARMLEARLPELKGYIGLEGKVLFTMQDDGSMRFTYNGALGLEKAAVGNSDFHFSGASSGWNGSIQYDAAQGKPAALFSQGLLAFKETTLKLPTTDLGLAIKDLQLEGKTELKLAAELQVSHDGTLTLASPSLNLPGLKLQQDSSSWTGQLSYNAGENSAVTSQGLLAFKESTLNLPAAGLDLAIKDLQLDGKTELKLAAELQVSHDGKLALASPSLNLPELKLQQDSSSWTGQLSYNAGEKSAVTSKGVLEFTGTKLEQGESKSPLILAAKKLRWEGTADVGLAENTDPSVNLQGKLSTSSINTTLQQPPLHVGYDQFNLSTKATLNLGKKFGLQANSDGELGSFSLTQGKEQSDQLSVQLSRLKLAGLTNKDTTSITLGELQVSDLQIVTPGSLPLQTNLPQLQLKGFSTTDLASFTIGSIEAGNLKTVSAITSEQLAGFDQLVFADIATDTSGNFSANTVTLSGLSLMQATEDKPPFLALAGLATDSLRWSSQDGFASGKLNLTGLQLLAVKNKDGKMEFARRLATMQPGAGENQSPQVPDDQQKKTAEISEQQKTATPIKVTAITIDRDSTIGFRDETLAVPFAANLQISAFSLSDLDSSQPEKGSKLLLEGKLEKKAPLKIAGTIKPFLASPAVDLELVLKNYPLTSLSPYTVQSIGTGLAGGGLKLQSKVALADDAIDMKNNLVLEKLKTKTIAPELAAELNNQLPVPLDAALAMMRDSDGNIALDIPISGPLDNLNVGIASVIVTALNKSIVSAASSYFAYALGPYAALAYVGMKVGEKMLEVNLPPVVFDQQQTELTAEHRDYLSRLATILTDRKDQDLRLTPYVLATELTGKGEKKVEQQTAAEPDEETKKELKVLADARIKAISSYMQEEHGVDKLRILVNDMVVDNGKEAKSRVGVEIK